jgi:hypothetical protein
MTETNERTEAELSFDEEVEAYLKMDPEERSRQAERLLAERIVYHRRKAREQDEDRKST